MKTARLIAVTAIFIIFLSGCRHKQNSVPPPQAQAPATAPAADMAHVPSLPALPPPPPPDVGVAESQPAPAVESHPRKTSHHKPAPTKPATTDTASTATPDKVQTQAATGPAPDASPIGQLSSTSGNVSTGRGDIEQLINSTEKGLNGINRTLSTNEQLTSTQIRVFLAKAREALAENDLDGAQTLAVKAKVLLEELTKK
ncbi:hypothetical protein [Acidobacterium sp. S8]|uniref:hypothetical protein n=1 Tax=Acidobacterium sp. S8 TaxID=1641854 RepID=UPI00131CC13A|nr:hypothetical protein [Acidobacterium sp. S8]